MGWGSGTAQFPYLIDPLSAITEYLNGQNPDIVVESITDDYDYGGISTSASLADTCLVFVNADSGEGYINVDGNAGDRTNLTLWHSGEAIISAAASVCSNTIVVGHLVGPVLVEQWIENPNVTAYINAGIPGQESGNAIVDVLFGAVNPSGRLPYTVAKQRTDYPADILYSSSEPAPQITYAEGVLLDYRWFDARNIAPRFEFGYGQSYTTFTYSSLSISKGKGSTKRDIAATHTNSVSNSVSASSSAAGSSSASSTVTSAPASSSAASTTSHSTSSNATTTVSAAPVVSSPAQTSPGGPSTLYSTAYTVTFQVQNTGSYDGSEVAQVYLGFPASAGEPPKVLRGFQRTQISKGQTAYLDISLRKKDVSVWDVVQQEWVVPSGEFTVYVGASSRDIRLTGTFTS
jgi:beta-glucosidase